jgi:hypothetical protein
VSPPDPWQSNPKTAQLLQQTLRKRLPPVATPAQARAALAPSAEPDMRLARVETSESVQAGESETVPPAEPNNVRTTRPTLEPARVVRREVSPPKIRPSKRNRVEKNTNRKLELMVLRTYERSDGKRFTRLLPLSAVRNAMAFQPDEQW